MNKKAFTLVELIVVITILAILGTIAMLSFSGYAGNARDSVRSSDLGSISSTLNIFSINTGFFPDPQSGTAVTYTGAEVWEQGVYGDQTRDIVNAVNKTPTDPLTGNNYAYSRTWIKNEFELGTIFEGSSSRLSPVTQVKAAGVKQALSYIRGNYNGKVLRVNKVGITYILAVPSIINSDLDYTNLLEIISESKLVYNKKANLPSNYKNSGYNTNGGFNYVPNGSILVYSGATANFIRDIEEIEANRLALAYGLQRAYSGTIMGNVDADIEKLINTEIDLDNPSNNAKLIACGLIDNSFGTKLVEAGCNIEYASSSSSSSSSGGPSCSGSILKVGTGQTYATILDAYNAADDGDNIIIYPGTHNVDELIYARSTPPYNFIWRKNVGMYGSTGNPDDVLLQNTHTNDDENRRSMVYFSVTPVVNFDVGLYHLSFEKQHRNNANYFVMYGSGTYTFENSQLVGNLGGTSNTWGMFGMQVNGTNTVLKLDYVDFGISLAGPITDLHSIVRGYSNTIDPLRTGSIYIYNIYYRSVHDNNDPYYLDANLSKIPFTKSSSSTVEQYPQVKLDASWPCGYTP